MARIPTLHSAEGVAIFADESGSPLLQFDDAAALVRGGDVTLTLLDTRQGTPDPGTVGYLRPNLRGARALRAALDRAIAEFEARPLGTGDPIALEE